MKKPPTKQTWLDEKLKLKQTVEWAGFQQDVWANMSEEAVFIISDQVCSFLALLDI